MDAIDYARYLGINLQIEPHLSWIAREMCASPLPLCCEMVCSRSNLVYFFDKDLGVFTLEHPLTRRYLKMLDVHRLEMYSNNAFRSFSKNLVCESPLLLFHSEYRYLQIPCEDCGRCQSTKYCQYCVSSFCDSCFDLLHCANSCRVDHSWVKTAAGSNCSVCDVLRTPNVFCYSCLDYYCFKCFELLHKKGKRTEHTIMRLPPNLETNTMDHRPHTCDVCGVLVSTLRCDLCTNFFCLSCFWKCHINGNRRLFHTASIAPIVRPLCTRCFSVRGSVFCDQCCEIMCTKCFANVHANGNRKLHIFRDAMNISFLTTGPPNHELLLNTFRAIVSIQSFFRGILARRHFLKRKNLAVIIQKRWRGGETRRKLLGMMDQLNWRRRMNTVIVNDAPHTVPDIVDDTDEQSVANTPNPTLAGPKLYSTAKQKGKIGRVLNFLRKPSFKMQ